MALTNFVAGKLGKIVSAAGGQNTGTLVDRLGASLQSYGGNQSGQGFSLVGSAYAQTPKNYAPLFTQQQLDASNAAHPVGAQNYAPATGTGVTGGGPTQNTNQNTNQNNDGGPSEADLATERYRNEISSAWDGYINSLDQQGQYIDQQTGAQRGIAENSYNQNNAEIDAGRVKSLKDLQSTARNALSAGNNYLGALGAGDSSASGMYNYAINRDQLKQVGNLDNFVMGQKTKLKTDFDNQILGIQNWFSQQQQALQQAKSEGLLKKGLDIASLSKDLLNNALQAVATAKADAVNRQNLLLEWAVNNSASQAGVQSTLNNIAGGMDTSINTTGGGTGMTTYGGYSNTEDPNKV